MLSEQVIISTYRAIPDTSSAATAEPSIVIYDLHSYSQTNAFKRSTTSQNCLAVTDSHVFAAQSDKAVLNVYNREKGNLETTVPFKEKFTVIEASGSGGIIAGGTEAGRLTLWETATGRYISTPETHLQKITCIVFDSSSNFIITGSADSNVCVWSLPCLLDVRATTRSPVRILHRHTREITALATGRVRTGGPSDILLTASRDLSCAVWDYHTGTHLRTYIFSSIPTSLALDPADRAFYAGLENGGVRSVDFFNPTGGTDDTTTNQLYMDEFRDVPITLPEKTWFSPGVEGAVTVLGVVYEGNYVVSGNASGDVCVWDVATGHMFRSLAKFKGWFPESEWGRLVKILTAVLASVAGLKILPPTGFAPVHPGIPQLKTQQTSIVKPSYYVLTSPTMDDLSTYTVSTRLLGPPLPEIITSPVALPPSSTPNHSFSPENDLGILRHQAVQMAAHQPALASKHKTEMLESELRTLYEHYDRLATLHRKTWESVAKEALE